MSMERLYFLQKYAKQGQHYDENKEIDRAFSKIKNIGDVYEQKDSIDSLLDKHDEGSYKISSYLAGKIASLPYVKSIHSRLPNIDSLDEEGIEKVIMKTHKAGHSIRSDWFYHPSITDGLIAHIMKSDQFNSGIKLHAMYSSKNPEIYEIGINSKHPELRANAVYHHPNISREKLNDLFHNDPDQNVRYEAEDRLRRM